MWGRLVVVKRLTAHPESSGLLGLISKIGKLHELPAAKFSPKESAIILPNFLAIHYPQFITKKVERPQDPQNPALLALTQALSYFVTGGGANLPSASTLRYAT